MKKNVLFCGFGRLGTDCLERLIKENYNIIFIMTHKENLEDSVDTFAKDNRIEYSYANPRKERDSIYKLSNKFIIDYIVSINYRYILPVEMIKSCKYALNIHGSLLPKYRGRTPHVWSIINGEKYTGVTCHLIDSGVDTGDIIEQIAVRIEQNDTGYSLLQKFQEIYPDILIKSLNKLQIGFIPIPQNERGASYYGKRIPEMGYIDFHKSMNQVINFVRAQAYPYPGAYHYLSNGRKIVINSLIPEINKNILIEDIGIIKEIENRYYVRCIDGVLKLDNFNIIE